MRKSLVVVGCLALAAGPAAGRHTAGQSAELPTLQAEYRDELARARRLRADAQEAQAELADLNRRLEGLEKARDADDAQIIAQRARLEQLSRRDAELAVKLSRTQAGQTRLLSALQMMSRRPPPPLLIPAERATDTVRAAILMKAMTPELQNRAQAVLRQQEEAARVRRRAVLASERLLTTESAQTDRRGEIEQLSRRKASLTAVLRADAERSERAARALEARIRALGARPAPLTEAEEAATATRLPGGRARLTSPIAGPGERRSNGLAWKPGARPVASPAEATVDYAGPLRGWGQVVILDLGPGWRAVVAGLDRLSVEAGTRVSDGQSLGEADGEGEVYFELRRADRPIDPRPFLD